MTQRNLIYDIIKQTASFQRLRLPSRGKMGQKAGKFYGMKKKEPRREKQKLHDWAGGMIEVKGLTGSWAFGDWLTGYAASGQAEHLQR